MHTVSEESPFFKNSRSNQQNLLMFVNKNRFQILALFNGLPTNSKTGMWSDIESKPSIFGSRYSVNFFICFPPYRSDRSDDGTDGTDGRPLVAQASPPCPSLSRLPRVSLQLTCTSSKGPKVSTLRFFYIGTPIWRSSPSGIFWTILTSACWYFAVNSEFWRTILLVYFWGIGIKT